MSSLFATAICMLLIVGTLLVPNSYAAGKEDATIAKDPQQDTLIGRDYLQRAQPYLDFIANHLFKPDVEALSETEEPIQGDVWYWTDDNAKAIEAFILPAAYAKY